MLMNYEIFLNSFRQALIRDDESLFIPVCYLATSRASLDHSFDRLWYLYISMHYGQGMRRR